ncbi:hypothetical protein Y032_0437g1447 [Ancylostoma ceylanicum]|uniref:Uncharacterized protein n=1 Tax=Ancylostoma ceylanicum TaxID=53326 RepID=A0A016X1K7_9BILA|nr:hypothetical protein Y032_0437g1447 [Ancylostoma ceylanicum]
MKSHTVWDDSICHPRLQLLIDAKFSEQNKRLANASGLESWHEHKAFHLSISIIVSTTFAQNSRTLST